VVHLKGLSISGAGNVAAALRGCKPVCFAKKAAASASPAAP
jgi:hypothetical protein